MTSSSTFLEMIESCAMSPELLDRFQGSPWPPSLGFLPEALQQKYGPPVEEIFRATVEVFGGVWGSVLRRPLRAMVFDLDSPTILRDGALAAVQARLIVEMFEMLPIPTRTGDLAGLLERCLDEHIHTLQRILGGFVEMTVDDPLSLCEIHASFLRAAAVRSSLESITLAAEQSGSSTYFPFGGFEDE